MRILAVQWQRKGKLEGLSPPLVPQTFRLEGQGPPNYRHCDVTLDFHCHGFQVRALAM